MVWSQTSLCQSLARWYVKKQSREAFIITTNAVEGMFDLLKRGIDGIYHWVSKKHLQKYFIIATITCKLFICL